MTTEIGKIELLRKIFPIINLNEINDIINSIISIDELFKIHNLNTNVNFFILSLPKTGSNTITHYIKKYITSDIYSKHSIIEFLYIDKRFINYTIKDIVEYIASKTLYDKLYIIVSYREPEKRYISRYLWNVKIFEITNVLENVEIVDEEIYNDEIKDMELDYTFMYNMLNDFNLNLSNYSYDNENGYTVIQYDNKINFVFTFIYDLKKMLNNFLNLNIETLEIINKNELNNKNIFFEKKLKDHINNFEKEFLNFYNLL